MSSPLVHASRDLTAELATLTFGAPVSHTYLPTAYARVPWEIYLERYGIAPRKVIFMGMNPGPYGMVQTGVPFGEVGMVRDWLKIDAPVDQPERVHPKRPIEGFSCRRSEVSGKRLWGFFAERFGTPDAFFREHFVANYCPLVWMSGSGANLTPDKLAKADRVAVEAACQRHLTRVICELQPEWLVGIGAYAEARLQLAAGGDFAKNRIIRILHPSPASPAANRGWAAAATAALITAGVWPEEPSMV